MTEAPDLTPVIAVVYDPASGKILYTTSTSRQALLDTEVHFVEVDAWKHDYDSTHEVVNGKIVEIDS